MQLNTKFEQTRKEREEMPTPRVIKKNKKHPPIYALLLEENLMKPNPAWDDTRLLLQAAKRRVAILEEAVRVGCDCHFSRRKQRWVLYRQSRWELSQELKRAGVEIRRVGNRDADFARILLLEK
jgi:uncharacterized protein YjiS (DUF1127 family)